MREMTTGSAANRIAVIAWGSAIFDLNRQNPLPLDDARWQNDGPLLPIEFAKVTKKCDGNRARVTLVILPKAKRVQTYWSGLNVASVEDARESLRQFEGADNINSIGYWNDSGCKHGRLPYIVEVIAKWARQKRLGGAVWTDFPPRLDFWTGEKYDKEIRESVVRQIKSHAADSPERFMEARSYVESTPRQIRTHCRAFLEKTFGWTCNSCF
jgi:hypothetical protein